jgi:hypothetical protein
MRSAAHGATKIHIVRAQLIVVAFALQACIVSLPGSDSSGGGGACAERKGNYQAHFVEQSGTCGPLADQVLAVESQQSAQMLPAGCTGTVTPSTDNCSVQLNTTCPGAPGFHVIQSGQSTWSADASSGSANLQITTTQDSDGTATCSSAYSVTYTRI